MDVEQGWAKGDGRGTGLDVGVEVAREWTCNINPKGEVCIRSPKAKSVVTQSCAST